MEIITYVGLEVADGAEQTPKDELLLHLHCLAIKAERKKLIWL